MSASTQVEILLTNHHSRLDDLLQDEERDRITYKGWDTSKEFLEQVVKEQGPFDGVMGFSQVQAEPLSGCITQLSPVGC